MDNIDHGSSLGIGALFATAVGTAFDALGKTVAIAFIALGRFTCTAFRILKFSICVV